MTDAGFAAFRGRLTKAKGKLEAAWKAAPTLADPATTMLDVAKGLGFTRNDMETWFRRAMEADPDNLQACAMKKDWLQPNWHGTTEDVFAFLIQCLRSDNYYGQLPCVAEVPLGIKLPYGRPDELAEYARADAAWEPFQVVAEGHLARYPDDRWARTRYAFHACLWRKWAVANAQFEVLGGEPWPDSFFREGQYEKYRKLAKENAGKAE